MTHAQGKAVLRAIKLLTGDQAETLPLGRNRVQVIYRRQDQRWAWMEVEEFSRFVIEETRR